MYIFLDESGELGFSKESSRYFLVTLLCTSEPNRIRKVVRQIKKVLGKKWKKIPELKANNSNYEIRKRMLEKLAKEAIDINYILVNKSKIKDNLREQKHKIFNWVCGILLNNYKFDEKDIEIRLIVDKRVNKQILKEDFDNYIKQIKLKHISDRLKISHVASYDERGIQAVDFISWAIFNKYEYGKEEYFNIINDRIKSKIELFNE